MVYQSLKKGSRETFDSLKVLFDARQPDIGDIKGDAWLLPYSVGFLNMLIGFQARQFVGHNVRSEKIGAIILKVWTLLTGNTSQGLSLCQLQYELTKNS